MCSSTLSTFTGRKDAEADMEGHMGDLYPFFLRSSPKVVCEMQPCRRGGCGALMFCIYGLITVFILQLVCDIWRQWHLSKLVQNLLEYSFVGKLNQPVAFLYHVYHRAF